MHKMRLKALNMQSLTPHTQGQELRGMDPELTTELKSEEAVTDERAGVFTPDKKRGTADGAGRAAFD